MKQAVQIPVGLDAAFNDCEADIAIAAMVGASFIRVPVFVDTVLFTDGIIQPYLFPGKERTAVSKQISKPHNAAVPSRDYFSIPLFPGAEKWYTDND